jgi:ABC-type Mn2+/Zn2+ transport system ATPase subunit
LFGYDARPVVQVRELCLRAGRALGIFGPNGAGKTTLVRGLCGLIQPQAGRVNHAAKLRLGYLPQLRAFDQGWPMTALDAASIASSAWRGWGWVGHDRQRIHKSLEALAVADLAHRSFAELSGGQQQRVLLAGALAASPQLLILDEPTEGLDLRSRQMLLETLLREVTAGMAIIIISHAVDDLTQVCDEVAWLHRSPGPLLPATVELLPATRLLERVIEARTAG